MGSRAGACSSAQKDGSFSVCAFLDIGGLLRWVLFPARGGAPKVEPLPPRRSAAHRWLPYSVLPASAPVIDALAFESTATNRTRRGPRFRVARAAASSRWAWSCALRALPDLAGVPGLIRPPRLSNRNSSSTNRIACSSVGFGFGDMRCGQGKSNPACGSIQQGPVGPCPLEAVAPDPHHVSLGNSHHEVTPTHRCAIRMRRKVRTVSLGGLGFC